MQGKPRRPAIQSSTGARAETTGSDCRIGRSSVEPDAARVSPRACYDTLSERTRRGLMKFQGDDRVQVQRELLVDAGHKVNDAVKHAADADDMEAKSIAVVTPPVSPPVALPAL